VKELIFNKSAPFTVQKMGVRKEFIAATSLLITSAVIASIILGINPAYAYSWGSAATVTKYVNPLGWTLFLSKTGVDVYYDPGKLYNAYPWRHHETCCGWYLRQDYIVSWNITNTEAFHNHYWYYVHQLCILGICAPPDQEKSYTSSVRVVIQNAWPYCIAYGGGTWSYLEENNCY